MSLTHAYCIGDLALASNIPLPELSPAKAFAAGCRFELLPPENPSPSNFAWFHHWTFEEGGKEAWAHFARTGDGYLLRFPSCGDFFVSANAAENQCRPLPGIPEVTMTFVLHQ